MSMGAGIQDNEVKELVKVTEIKNRKPKILEFPLSKTLGIEALRILSMAPMNKIVEKKD